MSMLRTYKCHSNTWRRSDKIIQAILNMLHLFKIRNNNNIKEELQKSSLSVTAATVMATERGKHIINHR